MAGQLYKDLSLARENLAVNSYLHLLYLVTPYETANNIKIIPEVYYNVVSKVLIYDVFNCTILWYLTEHSESSMAEGLSGYLEQCGACCPSDRNEI